MVSLEAAGLSAKALHSNAESKELVEAGTYERQTAQTQQCDRSKLNEQN